MRLQPRHILLAAAILIGGTILLTIALGGELRDLPWGAILLMVALGLIFARRLSRRIPPEDELPD